jgi:hypothetical protein
MELAGRWNAPRKIAITGQTPPPPIPPPKPPKTAPIRGPRFSWIVMRVRPPRTDTTISSFRWVAPGDATQEKDRPSWLTCPTFYSMRRVSSTMTEYSLSGTSPSTTRSTAIRVGPPIQGFDRMGG